MPRKGNPKVRTGCKTCKVRKVKCDEEKPHCKRCTSTGRQCDGYAEPPPAEDSSLTWHRPRHLFPNVNDPSERRSLHFFCNIAAPGLSGPMSPYFWTDLVMQFSTFEPAVRHSLVAVGALVEQVYRDPTMSTLVPDDKIVLNHYNAAIRHLGSMENEALVLLVCVLFICIEFLRGNRKAAIQHCRHGITILRRVQRSFPWAKEYLSPLFHRLSIIPFFFARGDDPTPQIASLEDSMPASFDSSSQATFYLDPVVARCTRLVRMADGYRYGDLDKLPTTIDPDLVAEQDATREQFEEWNAKFNTFLASPQGREMPALRSLYLNMRYTVSRIWTDTLFSSDETVYDTHIEAFRRVINMAWSLTGSANKSQSTTPSSSISPPPPPSSSSSPAPHPSSLGPLSLSLASENGGTPWCSPSPPSYSTSFIFESGFTPLLYFIIIRCRCLDTRLRALALMPRLCAARENFWDLLTLRLSSKRIIEMEHGCTITPEWALSSFEAPRYPGLPPPVRRVIETTSEFEVSFELHDGQRRPGRKVGFYMRDEEGRFYLRSEFVPHPIPDGFDDKN